MSADTREQRILRALIVDPSDRDGRNRELVAANHAAFSARPIEWAVSEDAKIYALVRAHLDQHHEAPDITAVHAMLRGQPAAGDLADRLERIVMVREFAVRSTFGTLLEELHDERRTAATVELAKHVVQLVGPGLDVGEGSDARRLRGVGDALDHVIAEASRLRATAPTQSIFERASSVREEDQLWLWNGYLPLGELVLLEGPSHAGKSTMLGALVALVTRGLPMPGETSGQPPADVVWISTEERASTQLVPRLRIAGADLDRVHLVQMDKTWSTAEMRELVEIVETRKPRLIVIDALKDTMGKYKDSDELEVRRALRPSSISPINMQCASSG